MPDLVLRQRYSTTDPEVATRAVRAVFGVGRVTSGAGDFTWEQRSLVDDGISVTRIACRGHGVRLTSSGTPDVVVMLVRSGRLALRTRTGQLELRAGALGLLPFDGEVELTWDETAADLFGFPLSSFGRVLGSPEHRIAVSASFLAPQSAELATLWTRIADVVSSQVLDRAELYERDVVRAQMIDALAALTVEAFGLTNSEEDDPSLEDEAVARAEAYMAARLGDPITIPDVAVSAGLSVRALQSLYQHRYGTTPVSRLRRLRLDGARAALRNPAGSTTVGAVARRFGYSNLGRFSAHYRDRFGEQPSRTLDAARQDGTAPEPVEDPVET